MREGDGQDAQAREEDLEEKREIVACCELVIRIAALRVQPAVDRGSERVREANDRDHGDGTAPTRLRKHKVDDDREQEERDQRHDGGDLPPVGLGLRPRVAQVCARRQGHGWQPRREIRCSGGRDPRRGRAPQRSASCMRERGAEAATTEIGCMSAEDPSRAADRDPISGLALSGRARSSGW